MLDKLLSDELAYRESLGHRRVTVAEFERQLRAIGYRRDTSMETRALARYMNGPRAGASYPSCDTTPVEADSGLRYCNVNADRGPRYDALKAFRESGIFAVSRGYILEL